MNDKGKLTSVHVDPQLFEDFKIKGHKLRFKFNDLVNNSLDLFMNDPEFRMKVLKHKFGK